ncbi:MAG: complex I subunit 1 family protein [Methanospirillum sp.]
MNYLYALAFIVLAPLVGGLIAGVDRKITARMQGRVGPPLLQPFYDLGKLLEKEHVVVALSQNYFVLGYLVFNIFAGALFFAGGDLLLVVFAFTLADVLLVLGAYAATSPYSFVGAERELIQLMAYEPMVILAAAGFYIATGSFFVTDIASFPRPLIVLLPGLFIGLFYVLTMKLRKSPFDISTSHHAHQEIVKGVTTEFSGSTLGMVEVTHWYETVFLLGLFWLFFAWSPIVAAIALVIIYLAEIFIDNATARVKWGFALRSIWAVTLVLSALNIAALQYFGGY